ncbi:nucleocapsid [Yerba mate chlorosis-associated virus]|uniref:Nucleoprotein n=1 Tax=Yerba mate chlorosis-associated virus TaxID=2487100 RepID=A0A3G3SGX6_9RHAB|nr:nucleocapsid [Yerba mate chlorosis-associated virus]AYR67253.1 nucleocapsid [Yerba mate chlorosis-associated virus]
MAKIPGKNAPFAPLPSNLIFSAAPGISYSDENIQTASWYNDKVDVSINQSASTLRAFLGGNDFSNKFIGHFLLHLASELESPIVTDKREKIVGPMKGLIAWPKLALASSSVSATQQIASKGVEGGINLFGDGDPEKNQGSQTSSSITTTNNTGLDEEFIRSSKFVAAFLMRLLIKTSDSVIKAWVKLPERYHSFYGEEISSCYKEKIKKEALEAIKMKLTSNPLFASTWVFCFNYTEQNFSAKSPEYNIINYLAIIPLGFAGMHALKLFLAYHNVTLCDETWLLNVLRAPENNPALMEIDTIMRKWFPKENNIGTGLFKYARLVDSSYFQCLQTKNCPSLVFLLVTLLSNHSALPAGADPNLIVGISNVSQTVRDEMTLAASLIHKSIPKSNAEAYSEEMKEAKTGKKDTTTKKDDGSFSLF